MCILFAGCDKEITETASDNLISKTATYKPMQDELQSIYDNMPEHNWGNIQVIGDGILKFECEDHFNRIYEWLRQDCETWDSLFLDNYNSLTEEEIEDLEEVLDYDEFQPLIEFEREFNVYGLMLRDQEELLFCNWLENGMDGIMPADPIFIDVAEQTLYNRHREVCISDTIIQYRSDGSIILIPVSQLSNLNQIRAQSVTALSNNNNLRIITSKDPKGYADHKVIPCESSKTIIFSSTDRSTFTFNASFRRCIMPGVKVKCTTTVTNYKQKNGKWKKTRKNCSVISATSFHYVTSNIVSQNPPVTNIYHNCNSTLKGNDMPQQKYKKTRTDVFTHPRFSLDFLELGIGINSVIYYSIDQNNSFFQIFND